MGVDAMMGLNQLTSYCKDEKIIAQKTHDTDQGCRSGSAGSLSFSWTPGSVTNLLYPGHCTLKGLYNGLCASIHEKQLPKESCDTATLVASPGTRSGPARPGR